jgi:DNA-binding response OmpR family regulator
MNDTPLVFLIGGDAPTHTMLRFLLEADGCDVTDAPTVAVLLALLQARGPSLVIVVAGVGGAGNGGVGTIAALHQAGYYIPTLLLTRTTDHTVRHRAFALGVLDVIRLPAVPSDLRARLVAVLGDRSMAKIPRRPKVIRAGALTLRMDTRELSDENGWTVHLTARETDVLYVLMSEPGQLRGRQDLLDQIWGENYDGDGNALEVYIRRLRGKMAYGAACRSYLHTLRGQGYFFDARRTPRLPALVEDAPHVLLVDDTHDPFIAQSLQHVGYIAVYSNGTQAVTMGRHLQPLLIMLNIEMGGMSGVEAHRRLRGDLRTGHIPTIAYATASRLRECAADVQANDYLAYPCHADELLLRVERLIGRATSTVIREPATLRQP